MVLAAACCWNKFVFVVKKKIGRYLHCAHQGFGRAAFSPFTPFLRDFLFSTFSTC
jgi:hypothetical protein